MVIDLRQKVQANADYQITIEDLLEWESTSNQNLSHLAILWTGWSSHWQDKESYLGTSTSNTSLLRFPGKLEYSADLTICLVRLIFVG